jgi:hypothetical protein
MKNHKKNTLASFSIIAIAMLFAIASDDDSPPASTVDAELNSPIQTGMFEVTFTSHQTRQKVGGEFISTKAAEGATYVIVSYKYKNITKKPIGMFELPELYLYSADGVKYDEDLDASSSFASESDDDEKVFSDLNPGISTSSSKVFEVSKELFEAGGWYVVFEGDENLKLQIN